MYKKLSVQKREFSKSSCPKAGFLNCQCPKDRVSLKLGVHFYGYILIFSKKFCTFLQKALEKNTSGP
jgi:hypothetical protein